MALVGEVVPRVEAVVVNHGLVLVVNLDERLGQVLPVAQLHREVVRLVLAAASDGVSDNVHEHANGVVDASEERDAHQEPADVAVPEALEHRRVVLEAPKEVKDDEHVGVAQQQHLGRVVALPVAQFVSSDADDLRRRLLQQRVVDHDLLEPPQPVKVHVRVGAALGAVHQLDLPQRELEALGQVLNARLQLAVLQRLELVEERRDQVAVYHEHEEGEDGCEPEGLRSAQLLPAPVHQEYHHGEHGRPDDDLQKQRQKQVLEKEPVGLLVESVPLLDDEVGVEAEGQLRHRVEGELDPAEDQRLHTRYAVARRPVPAPQRRAEEREEQQQRQRRLDDRGDGLEDQLVAGVLHCLVVILRQQVRVHVLLRLLVYLVRALVRAALAVGVAREPQLALDHSQLPYDEVVLEQAVEQHRSEVELEVQRALEQVVDSHFARHEK
ncbi:uncharacterized protein BcabD6B2_53330 [Babesia caballi]|uniref:Uncharacterized protein n=1 Tax=Babesia caballi TaxID=5871 RepID=A0AAV4M1N4_BABCB|nr:hypothetical protein, conserved [Babesia caballi]